MKLGFGIPVSGSWAQRACIAEVAETAERLGYDSLWSFQRTLYPSDGSIPVAYRSVQDPLAVTAFVAAITERVRIGVAVLLLPFYSPLMLAKCLTTADALSTGRIDVGLGLGWSPDEFAAAGVDMSRRGARAEEYIAALRTIWADGPVEFDGAFVQIPKSEVEPKPVQRPHPPILLGGSVEPALRRAGRLADGWISGSQFDLANLGTAAATVRDAAAEAGRDPATTRVIVRAAVRLRGRDEGRPFTGTMEKIREDIAACAAAGATEVFVDLNFDEEIGDPDRDAAASMATAREVLSALAPRS